MKLTFGKHKGEDLTTIPQGYLEWGAENLSNPKWRSLFKEELKTRNKQEEEFKNLIAENPNDLELIKRLEKHFWAEYEKEVADCEHEYDYYDPTPQIEKEIADYILVAVTEKKIKELKQKYSKGLGGIETINKIISYWMNLESHQKLSEEKFSTKEKFTLANNFLTEYKELLTDEYYEALMQEGGIK